MVKHLGWFHNGRIYDKDGNIIGTTKEKTWAKIKPNQPKGFKQFKPFWDMTWSEIPFIIFLTLGVD